MTTGVLQSSTSRIHNLKLQQVANRRAGESAHEHQSYNNRSRRHRKPGNQNIATSIKSSTMNSPSMIIDKTSLYLSLKSQPLNQDVVQLHGEKTPVNDETAPGVANNR